MLVRSLMSAILACFVMSSAHAATFYYTVSGTLGGDVISGHGTGQLLPGIPYHDGGAEIIHDFDFSITGSDQSYAGYVGNYTTLGNSADKYGVWDYNPLPSTDYVPNPQVYPNKYPLVLLAVPILALAPDIFATGGTHTYVVAVGAGDPAGGGSATFTSDSATVSISLVPLPAALPLFGSAFVGLACLASAHRKRSRGV